MVNTMKYFNRKLEKKLAVSHESHHPIKDRLLHSPLLILESSTLQLPDQIFNSSYCQPYNSYDVSSENLLLDQLIISKLIFFFILITYLVDIVLIAALAERSPIIIQCGSNPSRRKNLDVRPCDRTTQRPYDRRPYDRTTVQGATEALYGLYPQFKCMTFIYS